MNKPLFIGSFLSSTRGTKGLAESLANFLAEEEIYLKLASKHENKILRILDIVFTIFFHKGQIVHVDVFSGNAFNIAVIGSYVARLRKKKVILTLHGGKLAEFAIDNMQSIRSLLDNANYIQTPSKFLQSFFLKHKFEINYLPNPIKMENFPFKRKIVKNNSLLWVRAFSSIYNPEIPIRVLHELRKKNKNCTLTMIGPDLGLLYKSKELVNKLNLEDFVTFMGSVPNHSLFKYYQSHQVYLNTTSYESFGVAVLEAASCGIPIVSNNVGEIPFLWNDKEDIMLVENNNISMYCNCINKLFDSSDFSSKLSLSARKKSERFNWSEIKNEWVKILSKN